MIKYDTTSMPLDLEILDANGLAGHLSSGESLYITYANGKYWLKSRTFNYDVDWDTHFQVTLPQAREIIRLGYAEWWFNVDNSVK